MTSSYSNDLFPTKLCLTCVESLYAGMFELRNELGAKHLTLSVAPFLRTTMTTRYIPHIIYTIAITSISTHMLWQRKEADDQRRYISAHIDLLQSCVQRLKAGERISDDELQRIRQFGRTAEELERDRAVARGLVRTQGDGTESIGWREALLGGRGKESKVREVYEQQDLEKGMFPPSRICFSLLSEVMYVMHLGYSAKGAAGGFVIIIMPCQLHTPCCGWLLRHGVRLSWMLGLRGSRVWARRYPTRRRKTSRYECLYAFWYWPCD